MSEIDERIKQCDVDIAALEEQKEKLLKEKKEKEELKPGDVVVHSLFGKRRLIVSINGHIYAVSEYGSQMAHQDTFDLLEYKKVGECTGFTVTESS